MHAKSSLDIRLQLLNLIGLDLEGTNYTSEHDGAQKEAAASTELLRNQLLLASNITQT